MFRGDLNAQTGKFFSKFTRSALAGIGEKEIFQLTLFKDADKLCPVKQEVESCP